MTLTLKLNTYARLGVANLARVAGYRLRKRLRAFPTSARQRHANGPFFTALSEPVSALKVDDWRRAHVFGWHPIDLGGNPPDWHAHPMAGTKFPDADKQWLDIPDFEPRFGDIKLVWELSRFGWIVPMAQAAAAGDDRAVEVMNCWLGDWAARNPPYRGPNWKCGQEAGLRILHFACAALIMRQTASVTPALRETLVLHCQRIAPTMSYARGQDNNHGTSEAAALFIGGTWLAALGDLRGARWAKTGRRALQERVSRLVMQDGSFSQHSVTYHRLMLDSLSLAEQWRREFALPDWPTAMRARCRVASIWLRAMILGVDGDAPNLGANDGAHILALSGQRYRDFRPSARWAAALFEGTSAFPELPRAIDFLGWLDIDAPAMDVDRPGNMLFDDGGYAVLRRGRSSAMMRYARFAFRPAHADANHVDLWLDGAAYLRDGGTFSYNAGDEWFEQLADVAGHNTIQFGDIAQMPRIGRFLLGDWLDAGPVAPIRADADTTTFAAGYVARDGREHRRTLSLYDDRLVIEDDVRRFVGETVLRWRLAPGDWSARGRALNGALDGEVDCDTLLSSKLVSGRESLHYYQSADTPVWEVRVTAPTRICTTFRWS